MIDPNLVIVGVVVQIIGAWGYFVDTIRGKVQPNRVSWLLWTIAPLVAFAAEIQQGVGIQSLTTFVVGFVPLLIFSASFVNRKAEWKLSRFDLACGFLSIIGLIVWSITRTGNLAIVFSILADGFAAVPTIVKSFKEPESENHLPYTAGVVNSAIGVLAIQRWDFQSYAFPIYLLLVSSVIAALIKFQLGKRF
jgi:hypothetical protein